VGNARTKKEATPAVDPKSARRAALAAEVQSNPFRFLVKEEMELLFDLGGDVLTMLRGLGAPVAGKKMNPRLLMGWLEQNHDRVTKVRAGEEEN